MNSLLSKKNIPLGNLVVLSLTAIVVAVAAILIFKSKILPPQVPLFYGLAQGEGQLASVDFLILPFVVSACLLLANIFISFFIKDDFLKKALVASGILTVAFSLITVLRIIFLVGNF